MVTRWVWRTIVIPMHSFEPLCWVIFLLFIRYWHYMIVGIIIPGSVLLLTRLFNSLCMISFSWSSHTLHNFMDVISPSGPFTYLHHADEQIPLLIHTRQHIPLEYQLHIYDHPVTVWWLMQSKQHLVIVIRYNLTVWGLCHYAFINIITLNLMW
jgi:hypothetical protein